MTRSLTQIILCLGESTVLLMTMFTKVLPLENPETHAVTASIHKSTLSLACGSNAYCMLCSCISGQAFSVWREQEAPLLGFWPCIGSFAVSMLAAAKGSKSIYYRTEKRQHLCKKTNKKTPTILTYKIVLMFLLLCACFTFSRQWFGICSTQTFTAELLVWQVSCKGAANDI